MAKYCFNAQAKSWEQLEMEQYQNIIGLNSSHTMDNPIDNKLFYEKRIETCENKIKIKMIVELESLPKIIEVLNGYKLTNFTKFPGSKLYLDERISNYKKNFDESVLTKDVKTKMKPNVNGKIKEDKPKKKAISAAIKRLVWNKHIGEEKGKEKCLCCKSTDITQMSFHCGHIIAEINGGKTIVSNLKPICQNCNSSMAKKNMNDFMDTFK